MPATRELCPGRRTASTRGTGRESVPTRGRARHGPRAGHFCAPLTTRPPARRPAYERSAYERPAYQTPGLPAPFAPLRQVRALLAERRVVPVPGVEPRLVGEPVEDLAFEVVHQGREVCGVRGPPGATREQRVAREQVRGPVRVVVQQRDRSRRVTGQPDHLQGAPAD